MLKTHDISSRWILGVMSDDDYHQRMRYKIANLRDSNDIVITHAMTRHEERYAEPEIDPQAELYGNSYDRDRKDFHVHQVDVLKTGVRKRIPPHIRSPNTTDKGELGKRARALYKESQFILPRETKMQLNRFWAALECGDRRTAIGIGGHMLAFLGANMTVFSVQAVLGVMVASVMAYLDYVVWNEIWDFLRQVLLEVYKSYPGIYTDIERMLVV